MPLAGIVLSIILATSSGPTQPATGAHPRPAATFPPHGSAYVTSLPASASAWLDGTYIGSTPVYIDDLLPGRHSVTLSSAGWQPQTVTFDVAVGRIAPVSIVMARSSGQQGPKGQGM